MRNYAGRKLDAGLAPQMRQAAPYCLPEPGAPIRLQNRMSLQNMREVDLRGLLRQNGKMHPIIGPQRLGRTALLGFRLQWPAMNG